MGVIQPRPHGPRLVDVGTIHPNRGRGGWLGILKSDAAHAS